MRKLLPWLCAALLLLPSAAFATDGEGWVTYTGSLGFTLSVPDDWVSQVDEGEIVEPGDAEAMFTSPGGRASLTIIQAAENQTDPMLLDESAMLARCAGYPSFKREFYQADYENGRAILGYTYVEDGGQPLIEYAIGFITASDIVQVFTVTLDADAQDLMPDVTELINSLDMGRLRDDADG